MLRWWMVEAEPRQYDDTIIHHPPPSICNIGNYDDGAVGEGVVNDGGGNVDDIDGGGGWR